MNISQRILDEMKSGHGMIETICDLVENSDSIDYHDVAEIIKENPTMMATLEEEFKKRHMIKAECMDMNLTEFFEEL